MHTVPSEMPNMRLGKNIRFVRYSSELCDLSEMVFEVMMVSVKLHLVELLGCYLSVVSGSQSLKL